MALRRTPTSSTSVRSGPADVLRLAARHPAPRAARSALTRTLFVGGLGLGCNPPSDNLPPAHDVSSDCTALANAGLRAKLCDPELERLAQSLLSHQDEPACRSAARQLLRSRNPDPAASGGAKRPESAPRIHSVFEPPPAKGDRPLSSAERHELSTLPLPARLILVPDLAPKEGLPATTALIAGQSLRPDPTGVLSAYLTPGTHALVLRHAGVEHAYCLTLEACETRSLTTHGARLPERHRIQEGSCGADPDAAELARQP